MAGRCPVQEGRQEGTVRARSLDEFLKEARVPYTTFRHPAAFTAQDEAEVSHVPGRSWAKVVVCFADDEPILALPTPLLQAEAASPAW